MFRKIAYKIVLHDITMVERFMSALGSPPEYKNYAAGVFEVVDYIASQAGVEEARRFMVKFIDSGRTGG